MKPDYSASEIAARLIEERKRLGLTQEQIAAEGRITRQTLSLFELGARLPSLAYLLSLAPIGFDPIFVISGIRQRETVGAIEALRVRELEAQRLVESVRTMALALNAEAERMTALYKSGDG